MKKSSTGHHKFSLFQWILNSIRQLLMGHFKLIGALQRGGCNHNILLHQLQLEIQFRDCLPLTVLVLSFHHRSEDN